VYVFELQCIQLSPAHYSRTAYIWVNNFLLFLFLVSRELYLGHGPEPVTKLSHPTQVTKSFTSKGKDGTSLRRWIKHIVPVIFSHLE